MRFFSIFLVLLILTACGSDSKTETPPLPTPPPTVDPINELWEDTVAVTLQQPLWESTYKYDAAHILMMPMHYAFEKNDVEKLEQFSNMFSNLVLDFELTLSDSRIATSQFHYFISEYLYLQSIHGRWSDNDTLLASSLFEWSYKLWFSTSAWMWNRDAFESMQDRLSWRLDLNQQKDKNYYTAFIDEEAFTIASLVNMVAIFEQQGLDGFNEETGNVKEFVYPLLMSVLSTQSSFDDELRWVFQPGVWSDHRDYQYAGHSEYSESLELAIIDDIAVDSSHMHRWPLWIRVYERAFKDKDSLDFFNKIKEGMKEQFEDKVLINPTNDFPSIRVKNYFDGNNGLFRVNYSSLGNSAYLPYELSSILMLSWFPFMESEKLNSALSETLDSFPLADNVIELYMGPTSSRERYVLFQKPDYFRNGYSELYIRLALNLF